MFACQFIAFDIIITDLSSVAGKLCHLIGSWLGLFLQSTSILREGRSCSTRLSSLWSLLSSPAWTSLSITSFPKKDVVGRLVIQDFWQTRERDFFFLPTGVYRFGSKWTDCIFLFKIALISKIASGISDGHISNDLPHPRPLKAGETSMSQTRVVHPSGRVLQE